MDGIVQYGVVYTGGHGKIAEHGGALPQDRNVPLVVSGAVIKHAGHSDDVVETTQVAPRCSTSMGSSSPTRTRTDRRCSPSFDALPPAGARGC